jgi:hypothetical protein
MSSMVGLAAGGGTNFGQSRYALHLGGAALTPEIGRSDGSGIASRVRPQTCSRNCFRSDGVAERVFRGVNTHSSSPSNQNPVGRRQFK